MLSVVLASIFLNPASGAPTVGACIYDYVIPQGEEEFDEASKQLRKLTVKGKPQCNYCLNPTRCAHPDITGIYCRPTETGECPKPKACMESQGYGPNTVVTQKPAFVKDISSQKVRPLQNGSIYTKVIPAEGSRPQIEARVLTAAYVDDGKKVLQLELDQACGSRRICVGNARMLVSVNGQSPVPVVESVMCAALKKDKCPAAADCLNDKEVGWISVPEARSGSRVLNEGEPDVSPLGGESK